MTKENKAAQLPDRSEVKAEHTWRLEDIFPSDEYGIKNFKQLKN